MPIKHLPTIISNALEGFKTFDETFNCDLPTAHVEITNTGYGYHKSFFGDDLDVNAPLSQITTTYNLILHPDVAHEAIVEAIAEEFAKWTFLKLLAIEISQPTTTKWVARKGKAITREGQTTLTIRWSNDSRIMTWKL